jgi:hypothetical protein
MQRRDEQASTSLGAAQRLYNEISGSKKEVLRKTLEISVEDCGEEKA